MLGFVFAMAKGILMKHSSHNLWVPDCDNFVRIYQKLPPGSISHLKSLKNI